MKFFYPWGGSGTAPSNSAVNYNAVYGSANSTWNSFEAARDTVVSSSFTINKLHVVLDTAPGGTGQYTFTLRKNGADTGLAVTIAGASLSAINGNQAVTFAAGDSLSLSCNPSNTPAVPTNCYGYIEGYAADNSFPILAGTNSGITPTVTNFISAQAGRGAWQTSDALANQIMPIGGVFKNLRIRLSGAPGTGKSVVITLYKNGVASALSVLASDAATTGVDLSDQVSVVAGDTISIAAIPTNTPAAVTVRWSMEFAPTNNGESFIAFSSINLESQASTPLFEQLIGMGFSSWGSTESARQMVAPATTFKNLYVLLGTAPGGATSRSVTLRDNSADTALTTTVSGASTTNNVTSSVTTSAGDLLSLKMIANSTPAIMTNGSRISLGVYYAPSTNNGAGFLLSI